MFHLVRLSRFFLLNTIEYITNLLVGAILLSFGIVKRFLFFYGKDSLRKL
jgi:hypothetical protein